MGNIRIVSRQEAINHFPQYSEIYTGVILSNSEMETGQHSSIYEQFTQRVDRGIYRIHPDTIHEREDEINT